MQHALQQTGPGVPVCGKAVHSTLVRLGVQSFEDGTYHNEDEVPGEDAFHVSQVLGMDWSTGNSLKAGDQDFAPALLISVAGKRRHLPSDAMYLCAAQSRLNDNSPTCLLRNDMLLLCTGQVRPA